MYSNFNTFSLWQRQINEEKARIREEREREKEAKMEKKRLEKEARDRQRAELQAKEQKRRELEREKARLAKRYPLPDEVGFTGIWRYFYVERFDRDVLVIIICTVYMNY